MRDTEPRAGFIPYYWSETDNAFLYMFMVPSDARFGGTKLQIAKGMIDPGENALEAALREGYEELGMPLEHVTNARFFGQFMFESQEWQERYTMDVYGSEFKVFKDWSMPHFETGAVDWCSAARFAIIGRESQRPIIEKIDALLRNSTQ